MIYLASCAKTCDERYEHVCEAAMALVVNMEMYGMFLRADH